MRLSIQQKLFYSHFLAVILVSGSIGTLFYKSAIDSLFEGLQSRLKYSAALLSRAIDARELEDIRGPADVSRPAYQTNLRLLREFQDSNRDVAFIYIMRREGERIFFVIDSDSSSRQARPGNEYQPVIPRLRAGFGNLSADDEITRDAWGYFLSGYAPLRNGDGRYLIGIDMRAGEVHHKFQTIRLTGLASLLLSILLALLFSRWLARHFTKPIRELVEGASAIARGTLGGQVDARSGDELGHLAGAFNTMSSRLAESHARTQQALGELEESKNTLEVRVVERTSQLVNLNEQLVAEINERKRAEEALARAATTDYLTGLFNRRAMVHLLEQELPRTKRNGRSFSLVLADIDHFKTVNDQHGHEAGDKVLVDTAEILRQLVRAQDAIARWGGEELLIFLPETPLAGAMEVAEKVRRRFDGQPLMVDGREIRITMSLGVCEFGGGATVNECIRKVDVALYQAKAEGRNRAVSL